MLRNFICCGLILLGPFSWVNFAGAQETIRIAPASGGVELDSISIVRRTALGAVKKADLTNMQLGLWFASVWQRDASGSACLIHLQSLNAIEDDTGHLLLKQKRVNQMECLRGEVRGGEWKNSDGKHGPVLHLLLDAPAPGAHRIKAIKGKAQVSLTTPVILVFEDLAAVNGKILEHPEMESLAAMQLRFSVEVQDGQVSAKLTAPVNYASPWNRGRIQDWHLMDNGKMIRQAGEGVVPEGEGVTVKKRYRRGTLRGLSLRLVVLKTVESKVFSFDFRDVKLP